MSASRQHGLDLAYLPKRQELAGAILLSDLIYCRDHVVKPLWEKNLKAHGIKLPGDKTIAMFSLCVLAVGHPETNVVNKNAIPPLAQEYRQQWGLNPKHPYLDAQSPHHLVQQNGWNICLDDELRSMGVAEVVSGDCWLVNLERPHCTFDLNRPRKNKHVVTGDYCFTCGGRVGEWNWKYKAKITKVDNNAHCHPLQDQFFMQCDVCNRQEKNHYVYGQDGCVIGVRTGLNTWAMGDWVK